MGKIRVLVVEDSLTVRRFLCDILARQQDIEVVGEAEDGKTAIELCQKLRPDIITLDMMLPIMTGLTVTEYVMAHFPTPILIVSSSTNRGEVFKTYDALAAGAVDVLEKPVGNEPDNEWQARFVSTIKIVTRIRVITHPRAKLKSMGGANYSETHSFQNIRKAYASGSYELAAIGASTGGPGAIVDILRALPPTFSLPILLVLHIGEPFGEAFADWLDSQTERRVRYANDGEIVSRCESTVIMAKPNKHLVVREGHLYSTDGPERHSCRPSVDVLFESLAAEYGSRVCACLLTGMGRDGARGLQQIRQAGGFTIAQDEATSVVFGMPREAILLGAAERVLPLNEISQALVQLTSKE